MCQFRLSLNKADEFEELNLTRHKVGDFSSHVLELDVLTVALELSLFHRPFNLTVLGRMLFDCLR